MPPNKRPPQPPSPKFGSLFVWLIIILATIVFFQLFSGGTQLEEVSYSKFLEDLDAGVVNKIVFTAKDIEYFVGEGIKKHTNIPFEDPELVKEIARGHKDVEVISKKPSAFMTILSYLLPFILFIILWIFIIRSMRGGAGQALSFGKSRAKIVTGTHSPVTFKDVAGVAEAKEELEEIIEFLKEPKKFQKLGGRIPKGVLLLGAPGTGKTLLAKAVAGEAKVPFFSISGSDFVEMFVGVGASRVRDLFTQAKKSSPCIIFIDEIDAVGRHRGAGLGGGHDEREQTLNQLLVEMDGFEPNESVIVIAATNRPDILDPALLRPGRFDRRVVVDLPDVHGREAILKVHVRKVPLHKDADLSVIARGTPGFSGADIANLVNEAALLAVRRGHSKVTSQDFEDAKDKVIMGKERRSLMLTEEEKRNSAYHEAGHTLVGKFLPGSDIIHKVTIIPRGRSLGATHFLPLDDRHIYSKDYCQARIVQMLGGRVADEIAGYGQTTGAGNDIKQATELARKMVCEWGMSEKLGPITIGDSGENIFLGRELVQHENHSEKTAQLIDEEIIRFVNEGYQKCRKILTEHRELLDQLAELLLKKETIDGKEVDELYKNYMKKKGQETVSASNEEGVANKL
ncbi:MAG: ATP-dependent zinc metalloprotease FtsH [Candidatus Cloacimonadia bacterium]